MWLLVLHLRLAIATILLGDYVNGWVCHFGLKCSTFSTMNCGTSGRTPCTPYGNFQYTSVLEGNELASRILADCFDPSCSLCFQGFEPGFRS